MQFFLRASCATCKLVSSRCVWTELWVERKWAAERIAELSVIKCTARGVWWIYVIAKRTAQQQTLRHGVDQFAIKRIRTLFCTYCTARHPLRPRCRIQSVALFFCSLFPVIKSLRLSRWGRWVWEKLPEIINSVNIWVNILNDHEVALEMAKAFQDFCMQKCK